jgi:hypothetical protein
MNETDLFPILKSWFEERGFQVQAEVNGIDLVATQEDTMVVVEMKTQFTMKLLYQGCQRQRLCDQVYVAVPPITKRESKKERMHLLRRLHLGLLFVDVEKQAVEVVLDPTDYVFRRAKKHRRRLLKEMDQRLTNANVGGVTGRKLMTAYRETAIAIAYHLQAGPRPIRELKELVASPKVASILQKNYYHWFERVDRGIYVLTSLGQEELFQYQDHFDALGLTTLSNDQQDE